MTKLEPEKWVWLSFADGTLPEGSQFLGVCIVRASGVFDGSMACHMMGINPGGEVVCWPLDGIDPAMLDGFTNRLLTKGEADRLNDKFVAARN